MTLLDDIDLLGEKRLMRRIAVASLAVLVATAAAAIAWVAFDLPREPLRVERLVAVVAACVVSFALHELVHAALFKIFGGARAHVHVGARLSAGVLFAEAPGLVLTRHQFECVLLGPAVAVSVACLVVAAVAWAPLGAFVVLGVHLSGCTGDLALVLVIAGERRATHVEDTEQGIRLWQDEA